MEHGSEGVSEEGGSEGVKERRREGVSEGVYYTVLYIPC